MGHWCPYGVAIRPYRAAVSLWGSGAPVGRPYSPIGQQCPYRVAVRSYGVSIHPYRAAVPLWGIYVSLWGGHPSL